MTVKNRLSKAIDYLIANRVDIRNKTDVAKIMGVDRVTVSSATGESANRPVTKNFIKVFCLTFPEISEAYILGESEEMLTNKQVINKEGSAIENFLAEQQKTQNLLLELINSQKKEIEHLRDMVTMLLKGGKNNKADLLSGKTNVKDNEPVIA